MADISQLYVKTAPKNPYLTSQPRGFVTLRWNINDKVAYFPSNKCEQLS